MKNNEQNNKINQKVINVVGPLAAGGHTGSFNHLGLHNIYHVSSGFSNFRKMRYLQGLTKIAMLTSYLEREQYEGQQENSDIESGILPAGRGAEAGIIRSNILSSYERSIKEGNECGSQGEAEANVWYGIISRVADESGNRQQVLGDRRGFWSTDGYGPCEQYRFYTTLYKFYDIFDEEGCSKNQGEAGAYAAGYAGGALCECGGPFLRQGSGRQAGVEVETGKYSDGVV